ncbi:hypothetical protein TPHA_0C03540 [Tetrapisispora phaffii CBS 4417]|uniref:Mitochondrial glycine transporter n=1 Tax=Tetrapisispora phaffii (strain ATCC 24235 / CBS 4417 / NBRC 1672 / NRRL Y-8282 / UCD 70-5) TaxID=1071381 RepID=G8BQJ4_TETPH|nr:hypothetical protein TPHA_0C03540 [Tetrapisispora phaffii CBS 4417]CCE62506.1 hypothetical protein TPHA_0C03540 [Tetrapisispora phaffii CBS 4417]
MSEKVTRNRTHLLGGFLGGLTSAVALQPLDLLKTRIQQQKTNTLWSVFKSFDSPSQLWRGTLPSALRTSIGSALYLTSLNVMRTTLVKQKSWNHQSQLVTNKSSLLPHLSVYENLLTGAFARGVVGFITMPITVIKVRYESTLYNYKSINDSIKDIYKTDHIKGFFRGLLPTIIRDAPYAGIYVLLYEKAKEITPSLVPLKLLNDRNNGHFSSTTSTLINSSSAILAASLATTITAPFDTIKTRMQLQPNLFPSFLKAGMIIIQKENLRQLFSGLSMRLSRKAMSAGIAWGIYEELIKIT